MEVEISETTVIRLEQLRDELAALGIPNLGSVVQVHRPGELPEIVIESDPLTLAQEQQVRDAVAAHVPDDSPSPIEVERQAVRTNIANWANLTSAERLDTVRRGVALLVGEG